jgi:hypothetical protein
VSSYNAIIQVRIVALIRRRRTECGAVMRCCASATMRGGADSRTLHWGRSRYALSRKRHHVWWRRFADAALSAPTLHAVVRAPSGVVAQIPGRRTECAPWRERQPVWWR